MAAQNFNTGHEEQNYKGLDDYMKEGSAEYIDARDLNHFLEGAQIVGLYAFNNYERREEKEGHTGTIPHYPEDVLILQTRKGTEERQICISIKGDRFPEPYFEIRMKDHFEMM